MRMFMGVLLVATSINLAGTPLREPWMEVIPFLCMVIGALLLVAVEKEWKEGGNNAETD